MKVKLLLMVAVIGSPIMTNAQTSYLYNQGKMAVQGKGNSNTVLYINGDFISGTRAEGTTTKSVSDVTLTSSNTVLTGNFYHNVPDSISGATVFNAASNGSFEFRGTTKQMITTAGTTYSQIPDKGLSFIDFPSLVVNNKDSVIIDQVLGVKADTVNLTTGTLVLRSERVTTANNLKYYATAPSASTTKNPDERTAIAHLLAGKVNYTNTGTDAAARSFVEIQLALDPAGSYTYVDSRYGSLVGMGIPFNEMYADYFTWNYLLAPMQGSLFGPNRKPISDPMAKLIPGKGYFVGNGLSGDNYEDYLSTDLNVTTGASMGIDRFNKRAQGGYVFNRSVFASNSNNLFGDYSTSNSAYTGEKLNTSDVTITLNKGYNYLANPFTSPLDVTGLLTSSATTNSDWGVIVGAADITSRQLYNGIWIPSGASRASALYNMNQYPGQDVKLARNEGQVSVITNLAKLTGGTYIDEDGRRSGFLIPPLQMFIVYSYADGITLTIPASKRRMGRNQFIRSAEENNSKDDFVFQVYDKQTNSSDRVSIVLRPKSEILSNAQYKDVKKVNAAVSFGETKSLEDADLAQGVSSYLYTKSDNGDKLLLKFVPYTKNVDSKVAVPLYLLPSALDQEVVIKGLTLNTLTEFDNVILEDKLLGTQTLMTPDSEYSTTIKSTDSQDRFVLYFTKGITGIEDEIENGSTKTISSYYANGLLTVTGFDEKDFGSTLSVFDLNGRLVTQTKVNDFTVTVTENFAPGAFIVKVVGNNTYAAKFLVR